jgi:hypothetical protein
MASNLPASHVKQVAAQLEKVRERRRGRLIFIVDATASRQPTFKCSTRLASSVLSTCNWSISGAADLGGERAG